MDAHIVPTRPTPGKGCKTLEAALGQLHAILNDAGMGHVVPLLSAAAVRAAIAQALSQQRARAARGHGRKSETEVIRLATARRNLHVVTEDGAWPSDAWFDFSFVAIDSTGVGHDGLTVSLDLRGPEDQPSNRMTLPLLDIRYGSW